MDVNSRDPSQNIIPFRITGIEAARFDQNGNLGIGTTRPSAKLDISGNVNVVGSTTISGKLLLSTNGQISGLNNINPTITINGRVIEDKITAVVNMDSQVSTTALNKQKKQSIPLAEPSILRTNDIVAKMSGVSVGKTQVYGVGAGQTASYGNIVVAVGMGTNCIAYSLANPPTASSWVGIPNSSSTFMTAAHGIAYANGTWVAVGEGTNAIAYSTMTPPIASSWVGIPLASQRNGVVHTFGVGGIGRTIIYANGYWVAVGQSTNCLCYSNANPPTAESWIGIPLSAIIMNNIGYSIAYGNGTWVIVGNNTNALAYSTRTPPTDNSWTPIAVGATNDTTTANIVSLGSYSVTYANGVWLIGGENNFPLMYSVENPPISTSWMPVFSGTTTTLYNFGTAGRSIAYGNGVWVACGVAPNTFAYSTSPIPHASSWITMKGHAGATSKTIPNITFNSSTNTWFFCGGWSNHCLFYSTQTPPFPASWIAISMGPNTFTTESRAVAAITTPAFTSPVNVARLDNKVTFPANRLIAVGGGGGDSGTLNSGSGSIGGAIIGNRGGSSLNSNTIVYSDDDGNTWQMVPGGATNAMFSSADDISANVSMGIGGSGGANAVAWNGERWVAAGNGRTHSLAFSDDGGMTWTGISGKTIFSVEARSVAWNGNMWVAVGRGFKFSTAYSYDGITWMGSVDSNGNAVNVFSYEGPVDNSGVSLAANMSDISGGGNQVIWNGKYWIATGTRTQDAATNSSYTIAISQDGKTWRKISGGTNGYNSGSASATNGFDIYAYGIEWNGRNFVATGRGTVNTLAYSTDGVSWFGLGNTIFSKWGRGITWGSRKWVATGSGTNTVAYSSNGRNWTGCGAKVFKPVRRFMAMGDTPVYTNVVSGQPQRGVAFTYSDDGVNWDTPVVNQGLEFSSGGIIPSGIYVRTGGTNWRDFAVLLTVNTNTNIQTWGPDTQFWDINNAPSNEIAKQFSYFAGYWLNVNRAKIGQKFSVSGGTQGGTFTFTATSNYPVITYSGSLSTVSSGATYTLTPQADGIAAGIANNFYSDNVSTIYTNQIFLTNTFTDNVTSHTALTYSADAGSSWSRVLGSSDASNNGGTGMTVANNGCYSVAMNTNRTRFLATGGDIASATQKVSLSNDGFNWNRTISSPNSTKFAWVWASLWVGGVYNRWLIGGNDVTNNNNGRIMYSGDSDISAAWVDASFATYTGTIVKCFAANPTFTTILAGTTMNTILKSTNGGANWTIIDISGTPISAVNSIAFSPTANSGNGRWVAVGGGNGAVNTIIYSTDSTGNTWTVGNSKIATSAIFKTGECIRVLWDGVNSRFIAGGYNAPTTDISTLSNNYTVSNTITNSFPANINAINFDGIDDFIDISGGATNLNKASFTIECWIKTIRKGMGIVNCQNTNTSWETGEKSFYVDISGNPTFVGNGNNYINSVRSAIVNDGAWHHIAVVWAYSGSGTAGTGYIYVDGLDKTDTANVSPYVANNDNVGTFVVGKPNYQALEAPNFFNGSIFELRIWNVARSATQIQSTYNAQLVGNETGLVGYWRMNQGVAGAINSSSTIVANSKTTGGSTGTLTNFGLAGPISNWVYVDLVSNNLGYSIAYSDANGVNWFPVSNNNGPFLTQCRDLVALDTNGEYTPKNTGYSVTWNSYANRFIATGNGTTPVVVSNDGGVTWTPAAQQVPQQAIAVVCGKTASSAASTTNVSPIAYTIDGVTWQQSIGAKDVFIGASGGGAVNCAKYGQTSTAISSNGRIWVAGGVADATYSLAMSQNGIRWTGIVGSKSIIGEVRTLAYAPADVSGASTTSNNGMGNGVWVAGGFGTNSLALSYDGVTWSEVPNSTTILVRCNACTYGNGMFVAGGTGVTFLATAPADMNSYNNASFQNIIYSFPLTGSTTGNIWGSDIYRYDSVLAAAAVHAGVLANNETKIVYVQMIYNSNFPAITRNGVTPSNSLGGTYMSYRFLPSTSPLCSSLFAYSRDGLNWTNIPYTASILNGSIQCITYGKDERGRGLWVAGAAARATPNTNISILYSYNGIDWTTIIGSGSLSTSVNSIAYGINSTTGRGMWIAAVNNTTGYSFLQSSTGRGDWTAIPNTKIGLFDNTSFGATGISYLNGVWYATGVCTAISAGRSVAYSYDGVSWFGVYPFSNMYGVTNPVQTFDISMGAVATVNDLVMPANLTPVRASAWTSGVGSAYLQHPTIAFGAEKTVASTSYKNITAISPDGGRSWAATTTNSQYFNSGVDIGNTAFNGGVCNDAVWNGTVWVAVGLAANGSKVATSKDGVSWTQIPAANVPIDGVINAIMWNGNKWIIGGDGSTTPQTSATATTFSVAASTDAINWTGIALSDTNVSNVKRIAWNGMYWLAVGNGTVSTMMGSADGVNWFDTVSSASSLNGSSTIIESVNDIVWGGNRWIAVGNPLKNDSTNNFAILYSTDTAATTGPLAQPAEYAYTGRKWTGVPGSSNIFPYGVKSVCWNGKRFIATGPAYSSSSTGNIIAWSADGIKWTAFSSAKTVSPGQRWIAVGSGSRATIATSTDGKIWNESYGTSALFPDISGTPLQSYTGATIATGARAIGWNGNSLIVGGSRGITDISSIPIYAFIGSGVNNPMCMAPGATNVQFTVVSSVFVSYMDVSQNWLNTYTDLSMTNLFQVTQEPQQFSSAIKWNGYAWVAHFGITSYDASGVQYGNIWYTTDPLARVGWSVASNYATPRILTGQGGYAGLGWNGSAWLACGFDINNNNIIYTADKYGATGWTAVSSFAGSSSFQTLCIASSSRYWVVGGRNATSPAIYFTTDKTGASGWNMVVNSVLPGTRITSIGFNGNSWLCCGGSAISYKLDLSGTADIGNGWAAATGNLPQIMDTCSAISYNATNASWVVVGDASSNYSNVISYTTAIDGSAGWVRGLGTFDVASSKLNGVIWTGTAWLASCGAGSSRIGCTSSVNGANNWNGAVSNTQLNNFLTSPAFFTNAVTFANIPISLLTTGMISNSGVGAGVGALWRSSAGRAQGVFGNETSSTLVRSTNGADATLWSPTFSKNFLIVVGGGAITDSSAYGGVNRMSYSYNGGITWTLNNPLALSGYGSNTVGSIRTVKYSNGIWVAGGDMNSLTSHCLAYSRDGVNWIGSGGTQIFGTQGSCYAVCCNDRGRWVAVGGSRLNTAGTYTNTSGSIYTMAWSDDGINWTPIIGSRALFGIVCQGVSYGADASGVGMWTAIGRGGTNSSAGIGYTGIAYSYDAKNWFLSQTSSGLFGAGANVLTERYAPVTSMPTNNAFGCRSIAMSGTGQYQTVVVYDGLIYRSTDYGVTWSITSAPVKYWVAVAISSSGQYQITGNRSDSYIYVSNNFGETWTARTTLIRSWKSVAISGTGKYQVAVAQCPICISRDFGNTWSDIFEPNVSSINYTSVAISSTGQYITAVGNNVPPTVSKDYGMSWNKYSSDWFWSTLAMSATGQYQIGSSNTNNIYVSIDYGVNWNPDGAPSGARYRCVAISATGQYRVGVREDSYQIQISRNYGSSYSSVGPVATWTAVAISSTGQYVSAITNTATAIYISSNYGATWSAFATDSRSLGITYGKDASGVGLWVATAGRRDRDFAATSTNTMAYSYDGKLWRGILASACMSHQAWSVAYGKDGFGAGMWVAGGYDVACGLKWSYDGIIWNAALGSGAHGWASMAVGRRVTSVYWNGSIWYASTSATSNGEVSDGGITASGLVGYLLYSYNGKNWLPVLSNSTTAFNNVNTRTIYSSLPNSCILDFGSLYDDQSQRGTTITNTTSAGMIGPVYSGVPPKNVNTIVPFGSASKTTGQVPFLMGGDSGLVDISAGSGGSASSISGIPPITSELAATTTSLSTSTDGGITWRGVPNSVQLMTKVNKIMCDENTQQIVAVGTGNYSLATSTPAMCDASNGWVGVFGSRMTNTKTGLFEAYGTGAAWFSGAKMWIAGGRARTRRGSSLAVSVNGTVWQDAKIVSRTAAGAGTVATAGRGGGLLSRSMTSSSTYSSVETMLYPFTTFTFTPGGQTGRAGPNLSTLRTAYSSQPGWTQMSPYLNMSTNGIQQWTVPATGIYTIRAAGAMGGVPISYGKGMDITIAARLNKGEVIFILVGQMGLAYSAGGLQGGGGGGTFVVRGSQQSPRAIIVAGGGGGRGSSYEYEYSNASAFSIGRIGGDGGNDGNNGIGGTGSEDGLTGNGGSAARNYAAGGGGLTGNGGGANGSTGGDAFINGGIGGYGDAHGGFGGGGGAMSNTGGGGGGGYSGGGGGYSSTWASGGGGGSYNINAAITTTVFNSAGPGFCIITLVSSIPSPALSIFSTSTFIASSVIPYTTPTTSLLTYTDSATAFSTQVGSVAVNSQYNRAVVGGSSVQFVAGGRSGAAGAGAGDISNNLAYSYDGLNWTPVSYSSGLAGSGSGSIFQTPTNVATYTYAGGTCGLDASFGTIALTPRYTNTNQLSTTSVRAWFSIAISKTGQYQIASVPNEYIYISSDYGQNWTPATAVIQQWGCVAISYSGQYQMVIQEGLLGFVWISNNYGVSWAQTQTNGANIKSCAISGSGQYQTVTDYTGTPYILISSNYGINWARAGNSPIKNWASISMSETGQYMIAMTGDNIKEIWRSADYGNSWSFVISGSASIGSNSASISPSGQYQTVSSNSSGITSYIYISSDYGITWAQINQINSNVSPTLGQGQKIWMGVSISSNGKYQTAVASNSEKIYRSDDYGNNWFEPLNNPGAKNWTGVSVSYSGQYQTAIAKGIGNTNEGEYIYTSNDYGNTWIRQQPKPNSFSQINSSATGQYQIATSSSNNNNNNLYISADYGNTWVTQQNIGSWKYCTNSGTGQYASSLHSSNINDRSPTFDGTTNCFIDIGIPAIFTRSQFRSTMTIECWFKTADLLAQKGGAVLVSRNITPPATSVFTLYMGSNGNINFSIATDAGTGMSVYTTQTYNDTTWHHVAGTYNSTGGVMILYIDGVNVVSSSDATKGILSSNMTLKLVIGCDDAGLPSPTSGSQQSDRQFRGSISDVRIWNVVRSATDIQNNYKQRLVGNETGLIGYWKLNQLNYNGTIGSGWLDSTVNKNNSVAGGSNVIFNSSSPNTINELNNNYVSYSSDYGNTWKVAVKTSLPNPSSSWKSISMTNSGQNQTAVVYGGTIYRSSDAGITWDSSANVDNVGISTTSFSTIQSQSYAWKSIAVSATGQYQSGVAASGQIYINSDYGRNAWSSVDASRNWTSLAMSSDGKYQSAVGTNERIYSNTTFGTGTWTPADSSRTWTGISMSADGKYQSALASGSNYIYVNSTLGQPAGWTSKDSTRNWWAIAVSSTGQYQTALNRAGYIYIDSSFGTTATWTQVASQRDWQSVAMSGSGQYQTAVVSNGQIFSNNNYGANASWTALDSSRNWISVSVSSATGQYQTAVVQNGFIYTNSTYGAGTWTQVDSSRNWVSVAVSSLGKYQSAAVNSGQVYFSRDYGMTWSTTAGLDYFGNNWQDVAVSAETGAYQIACVNNGYLYVSNNSNPVGSNWVSSSIVIDGSGTQLLKRGWQAVANSATGQYALACEGSTASTTITNAATSPSQSWVCVSLSSTGQYQTAVVGGGAGAGINGHIYTSYDYGFNWTPRDTVRNWISVAVSSTGQFQIAGTNNGNIYTSDNSGVTWTPRTTPGSQIWNSVAISSSGKYQTAAGGTSVYLWRSDDFGVTWTSKSTTANWYSVAMSSTGQYQIACLGDGAIYNSSDYGMNWTPRGYEVNSVAISSTGQYQTATGYNNQLIYISSNYGVTWITPSNAPQKRWTQLKGLSMSASGQYQTASVGRFTGSEGQIYVSSDYGNTWSTRESSRIWFSVSVSSTGQYQTAVVQYSNIYFSRNYGETWSIYASYDNVVSYTGKLYRSVNYGAAWDSSGVIIDGSGSQIRNQSWQDVAMSSSGKYQVACTSNIETPPAADTLYTFTSHTFTNASTTGRVGPTLSAVRTAYSSASWASTYVNMTNDNGIQLWTVPATGLYTISCAGASGSNANSYTGGLGRIVSGTFTLTKGDILKILVGQIGATNSSVTSGYENNKAGTGGGGTFVTLIDNTILLIGGGGGGARDSSYDYNTAANGFDAPISTSGNGASGGSSGAGGGGGGGSGGGGGGYSGDGTSPGVYNGIAFLNNGLGGYSTANSNTLSNANGGGFGGGGGTYLDNAARGGGGGGYSGGSSSQYNTGNAGGGGSFLGTAKNASSTMYGSTNTGNGSVSITFIPALNYNYGYIYYSLNYGASWTSLVSAGLRSWSSVALSANGSTISATTNDESGAIWTYTMPDDQYRRPPAIANTTGGGSTTPATVRAIAYGNSGTGATTDGYWVAGADASANTLAYSSNGIDWTAVVRSKTTLFNSVNGVAYGADHSGTMMWVAVGTPFIGSVYGSNAYSIAYSYNMTTWIGVLNKGNFTGQGNRVIYGQDENGVGLWVAVGQGDGVSPSNDICGNRLVGAQNSTIYYSYDGVSWNAAQGTGVFTTAGNDISWGVDASGVATWVATGVGYTNAVTGAYITGGQIAYSLNGRVWTRNVPVTITSQVTITSTVSVMPTPPGAVATTYGTTWGQLGVDISGTQAGESSGTSVSLSADGTVVAIGSNNYDVTGTNNEGRVRIYKYNNGTLSWGQLGLDISGNQASENSGYSVSLSADGTTVAIGSSGYDVTGANFEGRTRIYKYNNGTSSWGQLGLDISGNQVGEQSGTSVSLSADGTIVAIGSSTYDVTGTNSEGRIRIYKYNGTTWGQLGLDISGNQVGEQSGYSVSLSADGTTVAIGSNGYDVIGTNNEGRTRIYKYNGTTWGQLGLDISGNQVGEESGYSVSLSADGTIVAIGSYIYNVTSTDEGRVRVYKYNNGTSSWGQLGLDISGNQTNENSGISVSLSADGTIVVIGSSIYDKNGGPANNNTDEGRTRVYKYNGTTWVQLGLDILGTQMNEASGSSVSISSDGTIVAIGSNGYDVTNNEGRVRVYKIPTTNAITYTSSNSSVADIYGNLLLIRGANETSNIVATQGATTSTGTLTVNGTSYIFVYYDANSITSIFSTAGLSVAYGNAGTNGTGVAQWIVGGSGGSVFWYSPRPSAGIWTSMAAASAYAPFPVCNSIGYSNGIWVASNNTNSTNAIARSTDGGATWTGVPLSTTASFTGGCADVAANSYCNFSLAYADYSTDTNLRSWVAIPGTKNLMFEGGVNSVATVSSNINAITYNNNRSWWVAGGVGTSNSTVVAALAYTTDPSGAIDWMKSASSDIANLASINDIAFSPQTQRWLAVGNGSTATPTRTALYSDASGVTWTSAIVAASDPSMNLNTCIWNQLDASASSAGRWLAGGTSSGTGNSAASLFVSTDVSGENWSAVAGTGAILSQIYSIAYNGSAWIASGVPNSSVVDASKCCLMRTFDISGASNWQPIIGTKTNGASANNGDGGFDTSARSITWNSDQKMWIATGENTGIADALFSSVIYSLDISGSPGTWRSVRESNSLFSVEGNGITFTGKKWVAAGEGVNTIVASSGAVVANQQGMWSRLSSGSNAMPIRATDVAYTGTSIIATGQIATGGPGTSGAIVSTDASGTSWSSANIGFVDSSGGATSIAYEPSYDGGLVVATGKGPANTISYSTDYGVTWVNATTRDASGANSTNTQQLFTTGGNSVEYIGNDTLFAGGGNDVHWNGKRWVSIGKTSERPSTAAATIATTTELVVINNNSSSIALSDDGITWSSVPSNQTSEMTEGTFIATNSRIGATPLINSQIVIMDGGDTELTGDFGNNANTSANGMGVGIAQIDIIGETQIIPSAASAISNATQVDLLGVAITTNGAGMTPIPSFDNTAFTITVRPLL